MARTYNRRKIEKAKRRRKKKLTTLLSVTGKLVKGGSDADVRDVLFYNRRSRANPILGM